MMTAPLTYNKVIPSQYDCRYLVLDLLGGGVSHCQSFWMNFKSVEYVGPVMYYFFFFYLLIQFYIVAGYTFLLSSELQTAEKTNY